MNSSDEDATRAPGVPPSFPAFEARPARKGILNPRRVRVISFGVITLGLFATALLCVLAIWDYASRDTAWRALATLGVLAATLGIFTVVNEKFGARLDA